MIEKLTLDSEPTNRTLDSESGWLHVKNNRLTQDQVAPYYGREIPQAESHGLDLERIYYVWRNPEELEKAVEKFNGIPLLIEHKADSADEPLRRERVGSVGTSARWEAPYIYNTLSVWDSDAIKKIEDGSLRDLSVGYRYEPDFTSGKTADGIEYDLIMRDIRPNHVALVADGRAPDCLVADENIGVQKMDEEKKLAAEDATDFTQFVRNTIEAAGIALSEEDADKLVRTFAESHAKYEEAKAEEAKAEIEGTRDEDTVEGEAEETPNADKAVEDDGIELNTQAEKLAFEAGVRYGEAREKANPERIDEDHEREGEERHEEEVDDDCPMAKDAALVAKTVREAIAAQFKAAAEVKPIVGALDVLSFDSAGQIYAEALKQMGVSTHVTESNAKSIFQALAADRKAKADAMVGDRATVNGQAEFLANIFNK